ncbi:DUF3303 family protein [Jannaschia seohaensis]|uniref:Uncharacterized protein n=1 Tax=Jannaschia seohaensis TaxID=475081 RepID=A0A2Y9A833_9RHOB|nr:DUF3303 family protein [Jannaschia seohaensis]PWJ22069.1 hypothetical protein BCF38_101478 [Jannaschia seohaensis]SSA38347.1 hypothetical protein SAMN05421539_101478 [Jannaschia seohaensis]
MHLLLHLTPPDYEAWKADFDANAETRMQAGLTLMQLWREAGGPEVTALFEVNDRARAQTWIDRESATGPTIEARFLKTA